MERYIHTFAGEQFRDGIDQIPMWAKAEHMERIAPQKELWDYAEDLPKSSGRGTPVICRLAALALFVAATFLIADDRILLGAIAFVAAAWLMRANPSDSDNGKENKRHHDAEKRRSRYYRHIPSHMGSAH